MDEDTCHHSWEFDGDDPYVICHWCKERRDAIAIRGLVMEPHSNIVRGRNHQAILAWQVVLDGNYSRYWILYGLGDGEIPWVTLPQFGVSASMEWRRFVHSDYVMEKLGLSKPDAVVVADYFNSISGDSG